MRNVAALTVRELKTFFVSPIAYVVMAAFLAICGYLFAVILFYSREASLRYLFGNMSIILLLISPLLTMRLLSEEQKSGTIELLLTAPVRDFEVVLGKFIASIAFLIAMLALTAYYPLVILLLGQPDWGPILGGYLGVLLLGSAYISLGLLASSLTQNQIVAAFLSFAALLLLWLLSGVADFVGPQSAEIIRYLGFREHFDDFAKGVIDLKNAVYYLSVVAASLFLTIKVVEARRWK